MIPPMAAVGAYMIPSGVFTLCSHLAPTAPLGSNCHIWLVEATLMLDPPKIYIWLPVSANPPGRIVPAALPGKVSALVSVVALSVAGFGMRTRAAAVVCPSAGLPAHYISAV